MFASFAYRVAELQELEAELMLSRSVLSNSLQPHGL